MRTVMAEIEGKHEVFREPFLDVRFYFSDRKASPRICRKNHSQFLHAQIATGKPHVNPVPRGSKTASHPNTFGPLAGTIVPSVRPSKTIGSVPNH